jgi:hypothetical protein
LQRQRHTLDERLVDWTAEMMALRYPQCDAATARRLNQICVRPVQAFIPLTDAQHPPDGAVIADLKLLLRAYLAAASQRHGQARSHSSPKEDMA